MRIEAWGGDLFEPWDENARALEMEQVELGTLDTKARDLANFIRSEQRRMQARSVPPEPDVVLPSGCRWQLDQSNEWTLLVPCGRSGFQKYSGNREELIEFARQLTPM